MGWSQLINKCFFDCFRQKAFSMKLDIIRYQGGYGVSPGSGWTTPAVGPGAAATVAQPHYGEFVSPKTRMVK